VLRYGARIEARRQARSAPAHAEMRTNVPDHEVAAVRDVRFSTALRGYDRDEVDRYMNRVNQLLAELQITAAPESAIQHALEQVSEESSSVIETAHREAEEITRSSRSRADDRIEEAAQEVQKLRDAAAREAQESREAAERDAREIREAAEARVRDLDHAAETMREEHARALGELRELISSLDDFVDGKEGSERNSEPTASQADATP
jgi:DivIVA domain-containing protein